MLAGLLGRRSPGAGSLAALDGIGALPDDLISALETRAIWAKFGLLNASDLAAAFGPGAIQLQVAPACARIQVGG